MLEGRGKKMMGERGKKQMEVGRPWGHMGFAEEEPGSLAYAIPVTHSVLGPVRGFAVELRRWPVHPLQKN
jgi:hypothetical protein